MSEIKQFIPQRHEVNGPDAALGMDGLDDHANALENLEHEIHLDARSRRAMAAGLMALGYRKTPHLSEHLAWLLEQETDELTAYSLYCAVLAAHPEHWTLRSWTKHVLRTTPFPLLRAVTLADLMAGASLDVDSEEGAAELGLLDKTNPEHRALAQQYLWVAGHDTKCDVSEVVRMLRPDATMPEKVAGLQIVQFASDATLDKLAMPALMALFSIERHPGLSLKIANVLVGKCNSNTDLDMVAFFIRTRIVGGIPAAETAMGSVFFGVEGFLMDSFLLGAKKSSALSKALLSYFSQASLPEDAKSVVDALRAISVDIADPFAAFAATAALAAARQPSAAGAQLVMQTAQKSQDAKARALAIRVLGQQARALLPLLDVLKALTVAQDVDTRVRRAAFHALVNTQQSGLPVKITEVIDLYFQYLREAPFDHFGDAVRGSDVARAPAHFLARFAESLDRIPSESPRQAAFSLIGAAFGFGIREEFEAHWDQVIQLMLRALDKPLHGDLHYTIFWNMLHEVAMPEHAVSVFSAGLQERLVHIQYTERTRGLIEDWLQYQAQNKE
jgi:hypothetical protein